MRSHSFGIGRIGLALLVVGAIAPSATALARTGIYKVAGSIGRTPTGTVIAVLAPGGGAVPSATNAVPGQDSFEDYENQLRVGGTNGWWASVQDLSRVVEGTYSYGSPRPIDTTHDRHLSLSTEGGMLLHSVTGAQEHVWVDMMVRLVPSETAPSDFVGTQPQLQALLYADFATQKLGAYARTNAQSEAAFVLSETATDPDAWRRLTLHLAYPKDSDDAFYSVALDTATLDWPGGELLPGVPSDTGTGPWLRCAHIDGGRSFPGLGFAGTGLLDDLAVTDGYPWPATEAVASLAQAVAITWNSDYGRAYRVDYCTDLVLGDWGPLTGTIVGGGLTETAYDTIGNVPRRFYRVVPLAP